ncbi:MAG: lipopolysaccharide biosynthesis protein [Clostridia bacterium]|nr:lipopolysaccharide biosynthesis protein [Clostridia bacterium]
MSKFVGLIVSIILARLLAPEEFGQVAIITVFINLCQTFVTSGFSSALVQNKRADNVDYSTVFYISLAVAAVMSAALILAAPAIGAYYDNDAIILPLRVYSLSLLVSAFSSVQNAKLQREMKFRTVLYTGLIATILSAVIGITMAALGAGIWALIVYYFAYTVFSSIIVLIADRWLPTLAFSFARAKELFSYGWKMLVSGLLCSIYEDIRTLVIGKRFSEAELGYYNRGQQFPVLFLQTSYMTVQSVMFPVMSSSQDNLSEVKKIAKATSKIGTFIVAPIIFGLAAAAHNIIVVLFTEKWLPAVSLMQIICLGCFTVVMTAAGAIAIQSIGRSDVYMKLELVRRTVMLAVLAVSVFAFKSVKAIAWGYAISSWIDVAVISVPVKKLIGYGLIEQLRDVWKIILASVLMAGAVLAVGLIAAPEWLLLIVQILVGIIVYCLMCMLLKIEAFGQLINIIKGKIRK